MSDFPTAPRWYRPILSASGLALRMALPLLRRSGATDRPAVEQHVDNPEMAHSASERIAPQPDRGRDPNLPLHVGRYTWALPACEGKRVVDLGCGVGYGTVILSSFARAVIGVDVSPDAVETAKQLYPAIDYRVTDLVDGELPEAEIGVCFEVLEHLREPERALRRFFDAYPRLVVSFPNPLGSGSHINPHHLVDWPLITLKRRLREAGARELKVYRQGYYSPAIRRWHPGPSLTWLIDATR
jgi:SAM-dependent methyltransferase